jgi:hypothetical protein
MVSIAIKFWVAQDLNKKKLRSRRIIQVTWTGYVPPKFRELLLRQHAITYQNLLSFRVV